MSRAFCQNFDGLVKIILDFMYFLLIKYKGKETGFLWPSFHLFNLVFQTS